MDKALYEWPKTQSETITNALRAVEGQIQINPTCPLQLNAKKEYKTFQELWAFENPVYFQQSALICTFHVLNYQ